MTMTSAISATLASALALATTASSALRKVVGFVSAPTITVSAGLP